MRATPNEIVSSSEPKSVRSSPMAGSPPPWMSWKSAGQRQRRGGEQEHRRLGVGRGLAERLLSRGRPPTSMAAPSTSRMFPITEPTIDAFTTSCRPLFNAKKAMISSGALPKVTFSRPPIPNRAGRYPLCGLAHHGREDHAERLVGGEARSTGVASASSSPTAAGMEDARSGSGARPPED